MTDARLLELLDEVGLPAPEDGAVTIEGQDPVVATAFPVGEAAALALAGCGVASDALWQLRGGRPQRSRVSVRHAAASLGSHNILRLNGGPARLRPRRATRSWTTTAAATSAGSTSTEGSRIWRKAR